MAEPHKKRSLVPDIIIYVSFLLLVSAFNYNSASYDHRWLFLYLGLAALGIYYVWRQIRRRSLMKRVDRPAIKFPWLSLIGTFFVGFIWLVIDILNNAIQSWGL